MCITSESTSPVHWSSPVIVDRRLVTPNKPADYTFKQLVDLVGTYHNPKPSVTVVYNRWTGTVEWNGGMDDLSKI